MPAQLHHTVVALVIWAGPGGCSQDGRWHCAGYGHEAGAVALL